MFLIRPWGCVGILEGVTGGRGLFGLCFTPLAASKGPDPRPAGMLLKAFLEWPVKTEINTPIFITSQSSSVA